MKRFALIAAAVVLGCGDSTSPNTSGVTGAGNITLSGAQTGTLTSGNVSAVWSSSTSKGGFALSVAQAGSAPAIAVAITFPGEPHTGHFKNTDVGAATGLSVQLGTASFWVATDANASSPAGSYDLNLTSVSAASTVSTGKTYTVSGTLDAVMPAVAGTSATGTVTMHVTF